MANLTYGIIRGESQIDAYCEKRWKKRARFCESFAHNIDGVWIERFYSKSPTDTCYEQYFLMVMETNKETEHHNTDDISRMVHEDIRAGRATLLKV